MNYTFPHTIENSCGEKIIFQRVEQTADGDRVTGESFCQPGRGPVMHCHYKQDEGLTVVSGRMGYQVMGEATQYVLPGESVVFKRGVPHKFWADGEVPLHCTAWIQPANTIVFFLTAVFNAQKKSGTDRPELFDAAYLLKRYAKEYELVEMPGLVKKVVLPLVYQIGRLLGKYRHFKNAPGPFEG